MVSLTMGASRICPLPVAWGRGDRLRILHLAATNTANPCFRCSSTLLRLHQSAGLGQYRFEAKLVLRLCSLFLSGVALCGLSANSLPTLNPSQVNLFDCGMTGDTMREYCFVK